MVVGAINVDLVIRAPRLPGPGETVVGPELHQFGGGKGANAAVAAARAGAEVHLVGAVGDDDFGRGALALLAADGVGVDGVTRLAVSTGTAFIVVDDAGENQIAVAAGANAALSASTVTAALAGLLGGCGCVLVSTEIAGEAVIAAVRAAAAAGVRCILNPAPVVAAVCEVLADAPILTPNSTELAGLTDHGSIEERAATLHHTTGAAVLVTLGADGVLVVDGAGRTTPIAARPAAVRDTTGAGDTFNGVLAAGLAAGLGLTTAAERAVVAASLSVTQVGAREGMPTASQIDSAMADVGGSVDPGRAG